MAVSVKKTWYDWLLRRPWITLSVIWTVAFLLTWPFGEFPLNDDWAYAKNVYYLSEEHRLEFSDWPAMTLIAQMVWGALISKLFGFSFTALRLSVFFLGGLGICVMYALLRKITSDRGWAILATLLFAFNPLYFSLACTFMTEVPFLVLCLGTTHWYTRYLKTFDIRALGLATVLAITATLIRQTGILLPVCFCVAALYYAWGNWKKMAISVGATVLPICILIIYINWLKNSHGLPASFSTFQEFLDTVDWRNLTEKIPVRSIIVALETGAFVLPLTVLTLPGLWKSVSKIQRGIIAGISLLCMYPLWKHRAEFPFGNVFYNLGVGPKNLKDTYWNEHIAPQLSGTALQLLQGIAVMAGALLIWTLLINSLQVLKKISYRTIQPVRLMAMLIITGYGIFILPGSFLFDRYMLLFVPFLILLILPQHIITTSPAKIASIAVTLICVFFSVAATHDYLAWNRARWVGLQQLLQQGITPAQIDGGFEFNGWYAVAPRSAEAKEVKSWWFVQDDEYVAAFGDLPCYQRVSTHPYRQFLTGQLDSIYMLHRLANTQVSTIACDIETISPDSTYFHTTDPAFHFVGTTSRRRGTGHSGQYFLSLNQEREFAAKARVNHITPCTRLVITAWCRLNIQSVGIVCTAPDDSDHFYRLRGDPTGQKSGDWQQIRHEIIFPDYRWDAADVYLWNHDKQDVEVDDILIVKSEE